ncbi:MAG: PBP1A family penicillin-binding protein [Actinomycetota bacterium]|nr:PBP1A family penicillin-binding protein [Actinomycetota bacterium]
MRWITRSRGSAVFVVGAALAAACSWQPRTLDSATPAAPAESSRILAADGSLITSVHAEEDRETVPLERIPQSLRDAVVAIEDERFWQHKGVDTKAVGRAIYADAREGTVVEGGSTITQQYVKNRMVRSGRNVRRKVQEASLAYQLEQRHSKERILEMYLNTIYFGNGNYGVQAASQGYFGVGVERLTLGQAALLAGIIRAPNRTDPYEYADSAAARRRVVLDKMVSLGEITRTESEAAAAEPLVGPRLGQERYPAPHFVERAKRFILDDPRFGPTPEARQDLLFRGGLRIETTLDLAKQAQAERAAARVLSQPNRDPAAAMVSLEPANGHVRALVGGRDFFGGGPQSSFDLATQGRRPAGSAFKPFVLAAALEAGIPLTTVYDAPPRLVVPLPGKEWEVDNYEGQGGGRSSLTDATVNSVNTVYARLILDVGPAEAVATAARMGITSPLLPYPSAVLGTNDVSPLDMASAYATLANGGMAQAPTFVTRVASVDGRVLYEHEPSPKRVLEKATVDAEVGVLRQVMERGTGVDARIGRPAAGKTGTGQEWRDAWFVGFTPELVTAVWVGFPDRQLSMVPPTTRIRVTGGSWPAQIWQLYMAAALAQTPVTQFPVFDPEGPTAGQGVPGRPVPPVVGMPVEQAEATLSREGFGAERRSRPSTDYPPGYVVGQTPPAGSPAAGGTPVILDVAGSSVPGTVPDVLDRSPEEARQVLAAAGLTAKVVTRPEPPGEGAAARRGRVWKQSPQAGTRARARGSVTIYLNPG